MRQLTTIHLFYSPCNLLIFLIISFSILQHQRVGEPVIKPIMDIYLLVHYYLTSHHFHSIKWYKFKIRSSMEEI